LREEVKNTKDELVIIERQTARKVAPFLDDVQQPTSIGDQLVVSSGGERRTFSQNLLEKRKQRYKLTLTSKVESFTPEPTKAQLKRNINATDFKVGIKAIMIIRNRGTLIETGSEEEMKKLTTEINTRQG